MKMKIRAGGGTTQVRQSNFELLRVLCIFGIVTMHSFGGFYNTSIDLNLFYGVLINSVFNAGVSLFVLISGYFGVNGNIKKCLNLELEVMFYSILSRVVISTVTGDWNIKAFLKAFFPVSTGAFGEYWFITAYMLLLIFSGYLNKVPEKLPKKDFEKLLLIMFCVFSLIPTIVQYHVMGDGGKGFANMLLMYFVGRYIRLYWNEKLSDFKRPLIIGFGTILLGFILNLTLTLLRGGKGVYAPFARDCSSIIVVASVAIFMVFKNICIKSEIINRIAKHVLAVYLLEGAIRVLLRQFVDIMVYADKWYLFVVLAIYVLAVMMVCMLVDVIRCVLAKPIENTLYAVGKGVFGFMSKR